MPCTCAERRGSPRRCRRPRRWRPAAARRRAPRRREGEQQQRAHQRRCRRWRGASTSRSIAVAAVDARTAPCPLITQPQCRRAACGLRRPLARASIAARLRVEVAAGGARGGEQQRARRGARRPRRRLRCAARCAGISAFGDALRLAGRVALEQRLDGVAGRRAEQRQRLVDRVAQPGGGEALRRQRRRSAGSGARSTPAADCLPVACVAVVHLRRTARSRAARPPARATPRRAAPRRRLRCR